MTRNQKWFIGIAGALLACLCIIAACLGFGGLAAFGIFRSSGQQAPQAVITPYLLPGYDNTPVPAPGLPGEKAPSDEPTPTAGPVLPTPGQDNTDQGAEDTLKTLESEVVPINEPASLASRLEGKKDIPETMEPPKQPLEIGAKETFWVVNDENNQFFQVEAVLRYHSDHLYFWVEDGVNYDPTSLTRLGDAFEQKIYPTDRAFFGSEWSPGIDNDVHLYALYARGLGGNAAAYFSAADEIPPQLHSHSNAHEMFVISADTAPLEDPYTYGTLAHEFQHMIHWYLDRNEESWLNEGFSELAALLNGYNVGSADLEYTANPDIQLTYWPKLPEARPHYGQAFLFVSYLLDRFGEKATQAVVANTDNGLDSIDKVLSSLQQTDPQTGKLIQADDLFTDWTITSFLNNPNVGDGRYAYKRYAGAPTAGPTDTVKDCSSSWQTHTVHQYGVNYIQISCQGNYTLQFQGSKEVGVLPASPASGKFAFWSNKGDTSDMTLTRTFDLTQASGPLTLKYRTWYDLEKDYDYVYLEASEDGSSWQILKTPSGRDKSEDPSGNAYGWGYNDKSGGWIDESVDLSAFAGKKVQLRFEYVTDMAVNGEGFMVDDIRIPEMKYQEDFEKGEGGWQGDGFVRIENRLPQLFRVSLISAGKTVSVQNISLDGNEAASIPLILGEGDAVLVVSGVTRFTTQEAGYQIRFQK